jgi:hypothetical protein
MNILKCFSLLVFTIVLSCSDGSEVSSHASKDTCPT